MPWSNKPGGGWNGGNGGGDGGGPWGGGQPPRGGGGQPPDLEDIIKKGQEQLKRALPGGGGFSPMIAMIVGAVLIG
ncbi:MAG: protease modulator HflK N-terminal domain-containing protein, partial [Rhizobiaceae bacterium]